MHGPEERVMGAYGLRLPDLGAARPALLQAPEAWPLWRVEVDDGGAAQPTPNRLTNSDATLALTGGGWMYARRETATTTLYLDHRPELASIAHPFLSITAGVAALWHGDIAVHAGAVVGADGAWGILGDKGAGKSSTVAALADAGVPVLSDDVVVVRNGDALVGPRFVDLRSDAGPRHPTARHIGWVGARDRWRLPLAAAPAAVPLRGWIRLAWADDVGLTPVEQGETVETLFRNLTLRIPLPDLLPLREIAAFEMLELRRPKTIDSIPAAVESLTALIGSPPVRSASA